MSPQEQEQVQREGLLAVNRIVDNWLDLRQQVAEAQAAPSESAVSEPAAGQQQSDRQASSAWAGEDQPLLEVPDVDAQARRRLSAQQGSPSAATAPRATPPPGR